MRVQLYNLGWGQTQLDAFEFCKHVVAHQVTLVHCDPEQRLCVSTDESDTGGWGIGAQVPHNDLSKDHQDQRHLPLAFLSGLLDTTELGWSVFQKEAYAVLTTLHRMH